MKIIKNMKILIFGQKWAILGPPKNRKTRKKPTFSQKFSEKNSPFFLKVRKSEVLHSAGENARGRWCSKTVQNVPFLPDHMPSQKRVFFRGKINTSKNSKKQ
jgi:hypothetical protein